jgi:hypothetical protein
MSIKFTPGFVDKAKAIQNQKFGHVEYEEGYADGIAGAGMQSRYEDGNMRDLDLALEYEDGFNAGSQDRKAMLANAERGTC